MKLRIQPISDAEIRAKGYDPNKLPKPKKQTPAHKKTITDVAVNIHLGRATKGDRQRWRNYCNTGKFLDKLERSLTNRKWYMREKTLSECRLDASAYENWYLTKFGQRPRMAA